MPAACIRGPLWVEAIEADVGLETKTMKRAELPSLMMVGLTKAQEAAVAKALESVSIKTYKVSHVSAACERLPITKPTLVFVDEGLRAEDKQQLLDVSIAVGAELVSLAPMPDPVSLEWVLIAAAGRKLAK